MAKRIEQLENLLRLWEDMQFLLRQIYAVDMAVMMPLAKVEFAGPSAHFGELRQHLVQDSSVGNFDFKRFVNSENNVEILSRRGSIIPPALFSWNRYSRRVFRLTQDMQTLLSATSLEGINWNEVKWPFKSFLLLLDEPIENEEGALFRSILVSEIGSVVKQMDHVTAFSMLMLSDNLTNYRPLDRKKIAKLANRTKWDREKMIRKHHNLEKNYFECFFLYTSDGTNEANSPVSKPTLCLSSSKLRQGYEPMEISEDVYATEYSLMEKFKHLVVSTCLYLATLPPKKFPDEWQPREKEMEPIGEYNPAAITTPNGVFTISCESTLSRESQETVASIKESRISREKRPHWRRGHWRRECGGRNNPEASRIWIRPCLINKHRLPPHSLPIGSQTTLAG